MKKKLYLIFAILLLALVRIELGVTDAGIEIASLEESSTLDLMDNNENVSTLSLTSIQEAKVIPLSNFYVKTFEVLNSKIYLAVGGSEKIEYSLEVIGEVPNEVVFISSDESVASISSDGTVTGLSSGTSTITLKYLNDERSIDVVVTDLISMVPNSYDFEKEYLSCNQFSEEENDLLDEILAARIEKAGYKTRAGAVEAARFLTLEFPYRITYFSENGRLDTYNKTVYADGEGRYYHIGLYLNESRYIGLSKTIYGPGTWGCSFYSWADAKIEINGLDCSGFVTWALLNAGFDPGDIGAGISTVQNLTDLGDKLLLTTSIEENKIKPGDLLSGKTRNGGHIAMLVGFDEDNYYVAEALWPSTGYYGVVIRTYSKGELQDNFYWHIDMDDYYEEDGNLTNLWY